MAVARKSGLSSRQGGYTGSVVFSRLKNKIFHVFFNFPKKKLLRIFLVIGVKPGKPLGMGEKSKAAGPESGKAKKSKNSSIY